MNTLSRAELKNKLDNQENFLLLNVLSSSSFRKTHIPDSQNAPISEAGFLKKVENILHGKGKDYPIVTYCAGFHCNASKDAANLLLATGYTHVSVFEGGMEDWLSVGYPISCNDTAAFE